MTSQKVSFLLYSRLLFLVLLTGLGVCNALLQRTTSIRQSISPSSGDRDFMTLPVQASDGVDVSSSTIDPIVLEEAKKFKIITCTSTTCCQRRRALGLDNLATFGSMYSRAVSTGVQVEEGPCVGSCKKAPCIAIEHDDFVGYVSLDGMTSHEFSTKAFHKIITEEDADRVWQCVQNAVQLMVAEAMEEDTSDEDS